jgi:CHAT domain-containing protein
VKSGDEVIGLYRALMFAGADTIVASLWEVDDASTAFLMTRFYTHLKTHDAPTALHMAQRDTAQKWPEPFHWAGFAVIGLERPFGQAVAVSRSPAASVPVR